MGGQPWPYFVPYQPDIEAAMEALQQVEFAAGRYYCRRDYNPHLPPPASIYDLRANYLTEDGSQSILDMVSVVEHAEPAPVAPLTDEIAAALGGVPEEMRHFFNTQSMPLCTIVKLSDPELLRHFGTTHPTREQIVSNSDYFEHIGRGCGIYIIAYKNNQPDEIHFAGYSFD